MSGSNGKGSTGGASGAASAPIASPLLRPHLGRARVASGTASAHNLLQCVTRRLGGVGTRSRLAASVRGAPTHGRRGAGVPTTSRLAQRVLVKSRFVRLRAISARSSVITHLAYVTRDGVGTDAQQSVPFSRDGLVDDKDLDQFARRSEGMRHQFRFIVSPEHATEPDLDEYTAALVGRMEQDLGTRLDWVAVSHHNTDNLHVHLTVNGVTDHGGDLVISRDYLSSGMRSRACELATRELGLRAEHELEREQVRTRKSRRSGSPESTGSFCAWTPLHPTGTLTCAQCRYGAMRMQCAGVACNWVG